MAAPLPDHAGATERTAVRDIERDLKVLLVEALALEGVSPDEIDSDEPLFGEGLGLDSIDGLELGVALRKAYGLQIEAVNPEVKAAFANIRSLARFVRTRQEEPPC
jgi:acyl carrier protein